jgi:uncharacterized protein YbjT (DUF2867 family)
MATKRVLVTGGGSFLGENIAAALLAEGADVTLLVRPGAEERLGSLAVRTRWWTADVWDSASLKGRARHHDSVVHTVGSMVADPKKGLSYNVLNFVSARNVANMCVGSGVKHMILLSSAGAPWVNAQYLSAKREAETYMNRVGLHASIIRAPLVFVRGKRRAPFYQLISLLGIIPPLSWTTLSRIAPMPVDVLARAVARITLADPPAAGQKKIYHARALRRLNTRQELWRPPPMTLDEQDAVNDDTQPSRRAVDPYQFLDEDTPFGWTPPRQSFDDDTRPKK